jgi:hypothetical protein
MHKIIFAAGAALAFGAAATSAQADADLFIVGLVGPGAHTYSGLSDEEASTLTIQGLASGAYNFTPELGIQGDILVTSVAKDFDPYEVDKTSLDGALHLFYRDPDRFLLGGFVQLGSDTYEYDVGDSQSATRAYLGLEGQLFIENLTLYGQIGATSLSMDEPEVDGSGWFGTIEARYFLTPDFKIAASAGFLQYDLDYFGMDQSATNLIVGASAEYKLPELPISLLAKVDYVKATNDQLDVESEQTRVMFGVKFAIGEDTLQDRDRGGASLKPVELGEILYGGVN